MTSVPKTEVSEYAATRFLDVTAAMIMIAETSRYSARAALSTRVAFTGDTPATQNTYVAPSSTDISRA